MAHECPGLLAVCDTGLVIMYDGFVFTFSGAILEIPDHLPGVSCFLAVQYSPFPDFLLFLSNQIFDLLVCLLVSWFIVVCFRLLSLWSWPPPFRCVGRGARMGRLGSGCLLWSVSSLLPLLTLLLWFSVCWPLWIQQRWWVCRMGSIWFPGGARCRFCSSAWSVRVRWPYHGGRCSSTAVSSADSVPYVSWWSLLRCPVSWWASWQPCRHHSSSLPCARALGRFVCCLCTCSGNVWCTVDTLPSALPCWFCLHIPYICLWGVCLGSAVGEVVAVVGSCRTFGRASLVSFHHCTWCVLRCCSLRICSCCDPSWWALRRCDTTHNWTTGGKKPIWRAATNVDYAELPQKLFNI